MSKISEEDLKIIETSNNYIKFENRKALFLTKIASSLRHYDEVVDVLGVVKGRDKEHDSYVVRFNDDTIENNIMNNELDFNFIRDYTSIECRKLLSQIMKKYDLNDKEAEEVYNASLSYDYEANDGTVFTTVESIKRLFTEEYNVNPSIKQLKAISEYIKETEEYYMLYDYEKYTEKVINLILNEDEKELSRLEFLNEIKDMINYNITCYSKNTLCEEPKLGFEKEYANEIKKMILIEQMIKEEQEKENICIIDNNSCESKLDEMRENSQSDNKEYNDIFYTKDEIKNLIKSNHELYFADDGINEVILRFEDIPDFIVSSNLNNGLKDYKFYDVNSISSEPVIKTMGMYLDKITPELRKRIIKRLVELQTGEIEPKAYKLIDEDMYECNKNEMKQEKDKNKNKNKNREAR